MGYLHNKCAGAPLAILLLSVALFLSPLRAGDPAPVQDAADTAVEAPAQEIDPDAELIANLSEASRRASDSFSAELAVLSVDNIKTRARLETKNLLYLLNRNSEKEKAAEQIEFLRLEELRKTLSEADTDLSIVTSSLEKLEEDKEGLELPEFTRVRNILVDYLEAVDRAGAGNVKEDFRITCDSLADDVRDYIDNPASAEAPGRIATSLDFLNECQQNSNSVRDISNLLHSRFSQPNIQASLGERVLFPEQPLSVAKPTTTKEIIRGTPTYSTGTVEGTLKPVFVANEDVAEIRLVFKADIKTNNTAVSPKGVSVQSNSYGKVTVYKPLFFNGKELSLGKSSSASSLNAAITGINTGFGPLGTRVAYDQVGQEYPYSKAESQRLMEGRVVREFDERVSVITEANERLAKVWNLLEKYDYVPEVKTRTTANMLELNAKVGNDRQITAASLPDVQLGPHDLVVRFHQSAINNPLHELFSGRHLSEKEVKAWIRENIPEIDIDRLADEAAEKLRNETAESSEDELFMNGENFYIYFCDELPACVTFDDGVLGIHVRIDTFVQKEKEFPGLDLDVAYKLEKKDDQWVLTLRDCEAWPPEIDRGAVVPVRYQVIRRQVKNRLKAMFPESIPLKAIPLFDLPTDTSETSADAGGESAEKAELKVRGYLNAGELALTEGWLVLGADYKPIQ